MSRVRKFLEIDVLTAARERLRHVHNLFDDIVILFSGGKDSLVLLYLVKELYEELGLDIKVKAAHRDSEFEAPELIEFVEQVKELPWLDLMVYAPMVPGTAWIMGKTIYFTRWDTKREWLRPRPEGAWIGDPDKVYGKDDLDPIMAGRGKGKVALMSGVRSAESLMRYRSVVNKLNDNYINAGSNRQHNIVKPIYDWSLDDVFKYLYDRDIPYCKLYDIQQAAGVNLRIAGPLHAEAAKNMEGESSIHPKFYAQIFKIFPEVAATLRYGAALDLDQMTDEICGSWKSIEKWITTNVDDGPPLDRSLRVFDVVQRMAKNQPESYPLRYVARYFINGQIASGHCKMMPPFKTR